MRSDAQRPRVGYILKMYPRFSETFILTELLAHEAAGLDLHIFSLYYPIDGHFHADLARVRAGVTYLPTSGLKVSPFWTAICSAGAENPRIWDRLRTADADEHDEVYQAATIARHARDLGLRHLHAHFASSAATVAMHAAEMAGITYSFTAHAKDIYIDSVDERKLRRKLREASGVITVSDFNLAHLRDTYGADAARVRRVYNGLHLPGFPFTEPRRREPLILAVGRLVEKKGLDDLVRACDILRRRGRDFRCEIIGDGAMGPSLAELIARLELGGRVRLLGPLPRDRVIEHMRSAAALAVPCVVGADGNRDGLPTVLLEAMALGTPCVATPVTGIPEVVRDGETGLLTPERDPAALADALARLLDDDALRVSLARAARARIEAEFDADVNAAEIRAMFDSPAPSALHREHAAPVGARGRAQGVAP